ncbi:hypothetical protein L249_1787 [Ophiocordyceps polyrhachis-furcata BCC 54312]|uniref:Uncharacterized protein n=1 Tax=Ophiocordyceps polyrhachis-furcata BCC 54312 TaxID=1330021 RepID=A0A367LNV7_9HYPO|nr:hypothetical protein L249_1787 [Ophiocordyceps polyrhachis-furcata BCC 54312]
MHLELNSLMTRVRIASIQADAMSRNARHGRHVVRYRSSKVTPVRDAAGMRRLAKTSIVRARREA